MASKGYNILSEYQNNATELVEEAVLYLNHNYL